MSECIYIEAIKIIHRAQPAHWDTDLFSLEPEQSWNPCLSGNTHTPRADDPVEVQLPLAT